MVRFPAFAQTSPKIGEDLPRLCSLSTRRCREAYVGFVFIVLGQRKSIDSLVPVVIIVKRQMEQKLSFVDLKDENLRIVFNVIQRFAEELIIQDTGGF